MNGICRSENGSSMDRSCRTAIRRVLSAIAAALSTLTPAITRARRSTPAQDCTAANTGTMNRPPAMARPARSIPIRTPRTDPKTSAMPRPCSAGTRPQVAKPRSNEKMPSRTAPSTVGSRMMRPAASHAARPEPTAMAIAKMARQSVATSSEPPSAFLTSGGNRTSASPPTAQNQQVTIAPHQMRESSRSCCTRSQVETAMFGAHDEVGRGLAGRRDEQARDPARQRERDDQERKEDRIAAPLRCQPAGDGAEQDRDEGRALDQRVAGRQFRALQVIGQDAVFDRAEQRRDHAEQEQRDEQDQHAECRRKPTTASEGDADLDELQPLGHPGLVEAVGDLAAERRQEEERRDEDRSGQRDQHLRMRALQLVQQQEDQRVLQEIVAEGRKELAPEQWREPPRQHQGKHGVGPFIGSGRRHNSHLRARRH